MSESKEPRPKRSWLDAIFDVFEEDRRRLARSETTALTEDTKLLTLLIELHPENDSDEG